MSGGTKANRNLNIFLIKNLNKCYKGNKQGVEIESIRGAHVNRESGNAFLRPVHFKGDLKDREKSVSSRGENICKSPWIRESLKRPVQLGLHE